MIDLKAKPFSLGDAGIRGGRDTLAGLTEEEKIGQLFCLIAWNADEASLVELLGKVPLGGIMLRPMKTSEAVAAARCLQSRSRIPVMIAANLEKGGSGIVEEGTLVGAAMLIAATDDAEMARKLGPAWGRGGGG